MPDDRDHALLSRTAKGIRDLFGFTAPGDAQTKRNAEWVRLQFEAADEQMRTDYLQAAARHPHLFQNDQAAIVSHVEPVVRHFASDGLTRKDYFKAVAAEPQLLLQKPATAIKNLEMVMAHYAADKLMRTDYIQAAVNQPILFRTAPQAVFATIEATVDRMEGEGIISSDCIRPAVHRPPPVTHGPKSIQAGRHDKISLVSPAPPQATPAAISPDQMSTSDGVPSTHVRNPSVFDWVSAQAHGR